MRPVRGPTIGLLVVLCVALPLLEAKAQVATPPTTSVRVPSSRRATAIGTFAGLYTGFTVWAYFAWYHNQPPLGDFTWGGDGLFGERTYAGGADKVGHAWINNVFTRGGFSLLSWGGMSRRKAAAWSAGMSIAYWTFIEAKDGYYYQFSYGDAAFNIGGAALGAALALSPRLDALLDFRVELWPSREYRQALTNDVDIDIAEDYSGQRYLLAVHTAELPWFRSQRWAKWLTPLDLSVGFETRNYKPNPADPNVLRHQHLFIGVALNAQGLVDLLTRDTRNCAVYTSGQIGHGIFEVFSLPKTSAAIISARRSPTRPFP